MFTWIAILCCHLVCGAGRWRQKKTSKGKRLGHQMKHGKAIWKPGIAEIVKASRDFAHEPHKGGSPLPPFLEPPAARAYLLTHVELCPTAIKLNPSWKTEVNKSAWIKPWLSIDFSWMFWLFICILLSSNIFTINFSSLLINFGTPGPFISMFDVIR